MDSHIPFYNPVSCDQDTKHWAGYTLVVPLCAVGNVGQLACDLIVSTLINKDQCKLMGRIYSPALMPIVGPNAFHMVKDKSIQHPSSSTEVYECSSRKLVIIQQRTSYFRELKHLYVEDFVQWLQECQFSNVIVLTSSFSQCNPDTEYLSPPTALPYYVVTKESESTGRLQSLNLRQVPNPQTNSALRNGLTYLPGSGLTKPLISAFKNLNIAATFLVQFCSEGDNIQDAYTIASILDRLLSLGNFSSTQHAAGDRWIEPHSWEAMF